MVALDIGTILFRDILRMYDYPGAPFSGEIVRDIVLYFFVPTVFLIAIIFFSIGIVTGPKWRGLRLLMGTAAYLFVIFSGYYSIFAYIAGPYFFILIVVVGLVYFLLRHFRGGGGGGGGAPPPAPGGGMPSAVIKRNTFQIRKRISDIDNQIRDRQDELNRLINQPGGDKAAGIVQEEIKQLKNEKYELEKMIQPWKKYV